jgi:hypothetical protein
MNRYIVGSLYHWVDDFILLKLKNGDSLINKEADFRQLVYKRHNKGSETMILHMLFYHANKNKWFLELKEIHKDKKQQDIWWTHYYMPELYKCIRYFEDVEILKIYTHNVNITQINPLFLDLVEYASNISRFDFITAFDGLNPIAFDQALIHYLHPTHTSKEHSNWLHFSKLIPPKHYPNPNEAICPFTMCGVKLRLHDRFTPKK